MLDAAGIVDWVRRAKAGDAVVYGRAGEASRSVKALVARLTGQDLITPTTKRDAAGVQLVMQRRSKRIGMGVTRHGVMIHRRYSEEAQILGAIRRAARRGEPCPSNNDLAELAGLSGPKQASYRLSKLERARELTVTFEGPDRMRVAILPEGLTTARPAL